MDRPVQRDARTQDVLWRMARAQEWSGPKTYSRRGSSAASMSLVRALVPLRNEAKVAYRAERPLHSSREVNRYWGLMTARHGYE